MFYWIEFSSSKLGALKICNLCASVHMKRRKKFFHFHTINPYRFQYLLISMSHSSFTYSLLLLLEALKFIFSLLFSVCKIDNQKYKERKMFFSISFLEDLTRNVLYLYLFWCCALTLYVKGIKRKCQYMSYIHNAFHHLNSCVCVIWVKDEIASKYLNMNWIHL
jgi:hypothetical protein